MRKIISISILVLLVFHASYVPPSLAETTRLPAEVAVRTPDCFDVEVYSSVLEKEEEIGEEESGRSYLEYSNTLDEEKEAYHAYLNLKFETKIAAIATIISKSKDLDKKKIDQILSDKNLSTWSLARDLVCSYEKYSKYVNHFAFTYSVDPEATSRGVSVSELLMAANDTVSEWKKELKDSKKALDVALATYDQFTIAFPLHLKYREVIAELILYRQQFSLLRSLISCLPSKFVNQSTTKCE